MAQRIAVIGTGYVGLIQAVGLADFGNYVTGVDLREDIVARLSKAEPTIFEHGLAEYLERTVRTERLHFTTDVKAALAEAEVVFVAVGTPEAEDGSADLAQIEAVVADVANYSSGFTVVVTKSTVPVGTNRWIADRLAASRKQGDEFVVVSNPEFLREGRAVQDFFHPDRIVIGIDDPESAGAARARELLEDVYRPLYLISTPFVWTNLETAELIKYASNAFLATKITFINQMANLAEAVGADVHTVSRTMGMDGRISPKFLHPGPGYGGSCFPKDTKAVVSTGDRYGVDMSLIRAVVSGNEAQKIRTAGKVLRLLTGDPKGMATGKVVAILGVAFKAETDDIRDSPAITVVRELLGAGAKIHVHDPKAISNFRSMFGDSVEYCGSEFACIEGTDAAIILTEWNEYRNLDLPRAASLMREPEPGSLRLLIDARNVLDPGDARAAGFAYYGTGR
ncbi:MAG: UDP-glucose dehydrogenase family protein [Spirochaetota bacterium]